MGGLSFEVRPAVRENVPLLLGIAGGTGSGKTFTALRLAKGIAGDKRIGFVDTENRRSRHYADDFPFDVIDLEAPFRPHRYADAIEQLNGLGYPVIVVDSMTHEWDGDGGCLDWQDEEFQRLGARNEMKMLSWQEPKKAHRKMLTRLLQTNAHLILCFRAAERVEMAKENGKTVVRPKQSLTGLGGWIPISEPRLPYELTLSILLTADQPGIPKPIKLEDRHKSFLPLTEQVGEETGRAMAEWAAGGSSTPSSVSEPQRRRLFAIAKEHGVDKDRLKELLVEITGQDSTAAIPPERYDALVEAVEREAVPA